MNQEDIDPFGEEDWEEFDDIQLEDIYDVIYGSLLTYYKDNFMSCHMIKTNDDVALYEKSKNYDDNKLICSFSIKGEYVSVIFETKGATTKVLKRAVGTFKLTKNLNDDKVNVSKKFRFVFNEYLKN